MSSHSASSGHSNAVLPVFTESDSDDEQSEDLLGTGSDESEQHAEQDSFVAGAADLSKIESDTEVDPSVYTPMKRQGALNK